MKAHLLEEIIIEDRQRKTFDADDLSTLADSIGRNGLLHAPVIRYVDMRPKLVVGHRRFLAMKMLHSRGTPFKYDNEWVELNHIPYILIDELDEIGYKEAELEENIRRVDLTWQEEAAALATLDELRRVQDPNWKVSDTAEEVYGKKGGTYSDNIAKSKILNDHMDDPHIAKAPTAKEALKRLERKSKKEMNSALIEIFEPETAHTAIQDDCRNVWPELSGFDCIITDPPYGVGANKFHEQATVPHDYEDDSQLGQELNIWLAENAHKACKQQAAIYLFCDIRNFYQLADLYNSNGWKTWETPIIWYKGSSGMLPEPDFGPRRTYEAVLYAYRGGKKLQESGALDVILNAQHEKDRVHGAQKSVASYVNLLKRSCAASNRVCDPFMGSGTIYPASNALGLIATGIESAVDNFNHAKLRIDSDV